MARDAGARQSRPPAREGSPRARRVFFALWPADEVRRALALLAQSLHEQCGGRVMRAPNIHVTLVFIGTVAAGRVSELERLAAPVSGAPFDLAIDAVRYWRHNRIVWCGSSEVPTALASLVGALSERLREAGYRLEDRPYVPHITLLRDARRAPAERALEPILWRAADFVLVESTPTEAGSRYDVLARWPLGH